MVSKEKEVLHLDGRKPGKEERTLTCPKVQCFEKRKIKTNGRIKRVREIQENEISIIEREGKATNFEL
jgi:hypothetical protein